MTYDEMKRAVLADLPENLGQIESVHLILGDEKWEENWEKGAYKNKYFQKYLPSFPFL